MRARRQAPRRSLLLASVASLPLVLSVTGAEAQQAPAPQAPTPQAPAPLALPTGGRVVAGQASIASPAPGQLTITQTTQRAAIDWQGFSVGQQGHVQFQQPNSASIALNRVTGPDASVIAGRITANGQVAIVNQSGVVFTPTARVDVGALVASAAGISNENFMAGRMVFDQAPRPGARVVNEGRITVAEGGLAALVAPEAANRGTIEARLGRVVIGGAETYALDLHGDGLLSLEVRQPSRVTTGPAAANTGTITAEGGTVLITAETAGQLVQSLVEAGGTVAAREGGRIAVTATGGEARVAGTLDARSATGRGGDIAVTGRQVAVAPTARLDASGATGGGRVRVGGDVQGQGTLPRATRTGVAAGATIAADATGAGQGGTVVVWADEAAFVHGRLSARGGPMGGDGGFIETSGLRALSLTGAAIDTGAPAGRTGTWLIDPIDLTISFTTSNGFFDGTNFSPDVDVNSATLAASEIMAGLASNNVAIDTAAGSGFGMGTLTVNQEITWATANTLILDAQSTLQINAPITGTAGTLVLSAAGGAQIIQAATGAGISVAQLSVTASGGISLGSAANAIASVGTLTSTGAITLASSVPMTLTAPLTAVGALSLSAPTLTTQALSVPDGGTMTLQADTPILGGTATAAGGRIILAPHTAGTAVSVGGAGGPGFAVSDTLLSRIETGSGTLQVGNGAGTGAITIVADITIAPPTAATLDLRSGAAITQAGRLTVESLAASGGSVTLNDQQNAISRLGTLSTTGGAISVAASTPGGGALLVNGPVTAAGTLALTAAAGDLNLGGAISATGAIS
nr:filamentous hemagglutinin N-terminal domain-containing protein [Acetobacteraceae bacterium]